MIKVLQKLKQKLAHMLEDKKQESVTMARNLAKEAEDKKEKPKEEVKPTEAKAEPKEAEVRVITQEQLILDHLLFMEAKLNESYQLMLEGFAQVGVKFDEKKP